MVCWTVVVVGVELVAGVGGGLNPNVNLGVLSVGLGGSEAEVMVVAAAVLKGLRVDVGFAVVGAGVGGFVT